MVVKGDSNKDGIIGTLDATFLMNLLNNNPEIDISTLIERSDINRDGTVNINDHKPMVSMKH